MKKKAALPTEQAPKKNTVPRKSELNKLAPRKEKNFVKGNKVDMIEKGETASRMVVDDEKSKHKNFGKVPK